MVERTIEERIKALESAAHIHDSVIGDNHDCHPEDAGKLREKVDAEIKEKQRLQMEKSDATKAKKKGGLFGDPVFVVE